VVDSILNFIKINSEATATLTGIGRFQRIDPIGVCSVSEFTRDT
jgi:hypothetical protein